VSLHAVVSGWLLGAPSGANRRLLALLAELGEQLTDRERVTVLHRPDYAPPSLPRIGWRAIAIPAGGPLRRARAERRLLPAALRELGATVYDHAFLPLPNVGVPTCLTVHDLRGVDGQTRWPRFVARAVLRRSCRRAARVIVPSEWTARRLQCLVPDADKPIVVHNAVAPPPVTGADRPPRPVPDQGYLLHVGHLEPRKNLEVVIDALAGIPPAVRPQLWLVGRDAGHGKRLEAHADRRGVSAFVHHLGVVPDDELTDYYRHARMVVVPSRYEGFGLPALEGLGHGRPVLAADAAALPEIVGELATLLPPGDAEAWRDAIVRQHPDRREDRAARAAWACCYCWKISAGDWLHAWRGACS